MLKKYYITVSLLFLFAIETTAQVCTIKNLSIEDGLSNNYVKDIVQDGQGFIWIASETGLSRFDGRKFTTFTVSNSELQDDAINTLRYDKYDNLLWIGTKTVLSALNCSTMEFTNYTFQDSITYHNIVYIDLDGDSCIWATTHYNGIVHYSKKGKQFSVFSDKNIQGLKNSNYCTFNDGKGHLFVGHDQNGLTIIDLNDKTAQHFRNEPGNPRSLPGNSVYTIMEDHLENIWIGTNLGLALFNRRKGEFLVFKHEPDNPHSLISDHIYDIKQMNDRTLWIASDIGGISILDLYNIRFLSQDSVKFINKTATSDFCLSSGNCRSLLQDLFGNIWIGHYSSGVDFIGHTSPLFHTLPYTFNVANILKNRPVWGICTDSKQQVWIGGENEMAVFKDNKPIAVVDITPYQRRPYTQIFTIKGYKQGTLLFLGLYDDGLLKLDTRTMHIERVELGMDNIDVITFFEESDGKMWIGTEYGVYFYMDGMAWEERKITDQLSDKSVYGILRDRQGKLWVGTYGGGIFIFDSKNEPVHTLTAGNVFFSNAINQLYLDKNGCVWVATRNGIGYIKDTARPEQFEWYGSLQGLDEPFVRAIQEDLSGNIWISTNQGISFWDKEKQRFNNYNRYDGIPAGNFIEGASCLTADGTVYFGSLNGVCYFNPQDVIRKYPVAPVQIVDCKRINQQVENGHVEYLIPFVNGHINLKHNQNSFRITFSVPDYAQNRQAEYAYLIEGLDNTWSNTLEENQVTFRNISPGKYTFKVKARLKNHDWDESHIETLYINIHPPLWFTWYAKLFYLLVACSVIYTLILSYKRKLQLKSSLEIEKRNSQNEQSLNQERLRFYTNITHELRTPLTLILGPLEDLKNDNNIPAPYVNKINTIHASATHLLNLINQILEFRKVETQNRKLIVTKGEYCRFGYRNRIALQGT